jgi:hypothetical protein
MKFHSKISWAVSILEGVLSQPQDEQVGEVVKGVPYYMHRANLPYWQHLRIVKDVTDGISNSFSLESTENKSFVIQAKKWEE